MRMSFNTTEQKRGQIGSNGRDPDLNFEKIIAKCTFLCSRHIDYLWLAQHRKNLRNVSSRRPRRLMVRGRPVQYAQLAYLFLSLVLHFLSKRIPRVLTFYAIVFVVTFIQLLITGQKRTLFTCYLIISHIQKLLKMSHLNFCYFGIFYQFLSVQKLAWTFLGIFNSKCKRSSLRSQCQMRLFCDFPTPWCYDKSH